MKTVAFFNNKGGVGKTTTIVNLASFLSIERQKRILLLDLDPQSNSTQAIVSEEKWMDFYGHDSTRKTLYDCFSDIERGEINLALFPAPVVSSENNYKIDLLPGHPSLSIIDDLMSKCWTDTTGSDLGAIRKLNWLQQIIYYYNDYDYIFIDMGPSLGALNRSALLNSDYFITPMASDVFSILGVENITKWMSRWMDLYKSSLENMKKTHPEMNMDEFFKTHRINTCPKNKARFIGYSVQQYSKRKFKSGERPTKAYEKVIANIDPAIIKALGTFRKQGLSNEQLKLGDVPYAYSIIPLSQTSNTPIFKLTYSSGLRGNQTSSVEEYSNYIGNIADSFLRNVGDAHE